MENEKVSRAELGQMMRDFQGLLDSPGWARLNKVVAEQLEARMHQVMLIPTGSGDVNPISAVLNAEYMKGEYNGQVAAMHLPQTQIDMIKTYLATTQEENTDEPASTANSP
jgi:hypothetical protein